MSAAANAPNPDSADAPRYEPHRKIRVVLGPLFGLVGTVYSMIGAFMEMADPSKQADPHKMASTLSHGLVVTKTDADTARIHLKDGEVPADRDFVLSWKPEPATAPTASLFRENRNGEDYLLAVVNPPALLDIFSPVASARCSECSQ